MRGREREGMERESSDWVRCHVCVCVCVYERSVTCVISKCTSVFVRSCSSILAPTFPRTAYSVVQDLSVGVMSTEDLVTERDSTRFCDDSLKTYLFRGEMKFHFLLFRSGRGKVTSTLKSGSNERTTPTTRRSGRIIPACASHKPKFGFF